MVDLFQPSFLLEVIIIFDWLGDIISGMGDAIGNAFSGISDSIIDAILNRFIQNKHIVIVWSLRRIFQFQTFMADMP